MEPVWTAVANLGGGFALSIIILVLHREALKAFREEMAAERTRNDANLTRFFDKMDLLKTAFEGAKCRAPQSEAELRTFVSSLTHHVRRLERGE